MMLGGRAGGWVCALAWLAWMQPTAANEAASREVPATVMQPRASGYFVGDVAVQRILLDTPAGRYQPDELPGSVRVSAWFERHAVRIERHDGRRWLAVDYLIVNAPRSVTEVKLPGWALDANNSTVALSVPQATLQIAPMIAHDPLRTPRIGDLRPDQSALTIATAPLRWRVVFWSAALLATLGAWLGWLMWRNAQAARTQPFARAARALRGLSGDSPQAWAILHRAFDATAQRVVQLDSLPILLARAPHFEAMRPSIEHFYRQSGERFFGSGVVGESVSVHRLCRELRLVEKRRES